MHFDPISSYENEVITRSAPRWAWDIIDDVLAQTEDAAIFPADYYEQLGKALNAVITSCEGE